VLIVGSSGSGKSTLTIGLIRKGWGYLSDDAVLLRKSSEAVEAMALRKYCYIDAQTAVDYSDFRLGQKVPDAIRGQRQRVYVDETYPGKAVPTCVPQILVFSRIVSEAVSTLKPVTRVDALKNLLTESGPQLFDQTSMPHHMEVLKTLLSQAKTYELQAGLDLHRDPLILERLLTQAGKVA
jgi:adenylate kinase family enzyme